MSPTKKKKTSNEKERRSPSPSGSSPSTATAPAAVDTEEAAFLRDYDMTAFPRPSVAVDVVALTLQGGALHVALYRRGEHPGKGRYALPGGFVRLDESLDAAARRVVAQKAGLEQVFLEQLHTFGELGRDPRGRILTVAYIALVDAGRFHRALERGTGDLVLARVEVPWRDRTGGPVAVIDDAGQELRCAFDHADIVGFAIKRLRERIDDTPIGFQLLATKFTLRQLQDVHEAVRGTNVNKDSFRRRMLGTGLLEATGDHETGATWRPAELYRFVRLAAV
jgi:8-oxo-dGTP diphosphatase